VSVFAQILHTAIGGIHEVRLAVQLDSWLTPCPRYFIETRNGFIRLSESWHNRVVEELFSACKSPYREFPTLITSSDSHVHTIVVQADKQELDSLTAIMLLHTLCGKIQGTDPTIKYQYWNVENKNWQQMKFRIIFEHIIHQGERMTRRSIREHQKYGGADCRQIFTRLHRI